MSALVRSMFVFVFVFAIACKGKSAPPATEATSPKTAARLFDGPTFTVSTTFTGPETTKHDLGSDGGNATLVMYDFSDPADGANGEMVTTTPVSSRSDGVDKQLEDAMDRNAQESHATIDTKKTVNVDGLPILDYTVHFTKDGGTYFYRGRETIKSNTMYQVITMGHGATPPAWAEAFVTSFKIK